MTVWTCEECGRSFGAVGRAHQCEPGVTVAEFLDGAVPCTTEVLARITSHLQELDGDVIVDPLSHMVLFKRSAAFAMVRKRKRWVAVEFNLRRPLVSARLSRKTTEHPGGYWHVVNIDDPAQVDDELLGWLTDAYHSKDAARPSADPMIPDDVDVDLV